MLGRRSGGVADRDASLLPTATLDDFGDEMPARSRQDAPEMEMTRATWGNPLIDLYAPGAPPPKSDNRVNFAAGRPTAREFPDMDRIRTSFMADANSRPRVAVLGPPVSLWGEMIVSMDAALFGKRSASAEHIFEFQNVRSAAQVREAVRDEVRVSLPENEKYRVVSLMYASNNNGDNPDDLIDMDELEDEDVQGLAAEPLRIEVRIGLASGLLLSSDMLEHDEGKELFEHDVGDDNYKLTVHVARGKDLRGMSKSGTSNPFVQCELCKEIEGESGEVAYELVDFLPASGKKRSTRRTKKATHARFCKQTSVIKRNNINPQWGEDLSFDIPLAACSKQQLESCVLRIKCFSADSVLSSPVKWTTTDNLIGATTITMVEVLETIGSVNDREDDDDNHHGSSDWYCIMDKTMTATRKKRLSAGANQALRVVGSVGSRLNRASHKRHAEPIPELVDDLTEAEEEEEKTGDLQLSFSLVEPEGNEDDPATTKAQPATGTGDTWGPEPQPQPQPQPEPEPEPEPEPISELPQPEPETEAEPEPEVEEEEEAATSPFCDGTIEVEVVRCTNILAPHKKHPANVFVTMALYSSSPYAHRQMKSTDCVECAKDDLDPIFGGMHMQELDIYKIENTHVLVLRLMHKKQDRSGQTEVLGETAVNLREHFEQAEKRFGRWDAKISPMLKLDGQNATPAVQKVKGNSQKIKSGECGTIEVKIHFKPNISASFKGRKPVQQHAPTKDANIQKLFRDSAHACPSPEKTSSPVPFAASVQTTATSSGFQAVSDTPIQPDALGFQLKNCKVDVLILGARELVRKPRKPEIVCEYICTGAQDKKQSFRVTDGGQNPTFTAARSDLERKSAAKLRKMIEESKSIVMPIDATKHELVQTMLEVPHLTIDDVQFPFDRSKPTRLKISVYERPLRGPPKEFGSTTIKLCCADVVDDGGDGATPDEKAMQLWQGACDSYIKGVTTLWESTRNPRKVSLQQVTMWWEQRIEFNQKEAEETLKRAMLWWWTIHSKDGKVTVQQLLQRTWNDDGVQAAAASLVQLAGTTEVRKQGAQKALLNQIFSIVPDAGSVDNILNAHMDLKRRSAQTTQNDQRIYRHDVQQWWERNSIRSAHIFESAWKDTVIGADFIAARQFPQFLIKLLKPSAEDLRTAISCFESTDVPGIKEWWAKELDSLSSSRPKSKHELRSLLLDENRLSAHFGQQADAPGPAETDYIVDAEEQEKQQAFLGLGDWAQAGGVHAEEDRDDIRIEVEDNSARASRFDAFLAQWRQMYDKHGGEIPLIEHEWHKAWTSKNDNQRMTMSSTSLSSGDTALFTRENFVEVLQQVLMLDDNIAEKVFKDLDTDSSGEVDKDEAQEWFDRNAQQGGQLRFERAWTLADEDCSNAMNFAEFRRFIQLLLCPTDTDVDVILDEISQVEGTTKTDDVLRKNRGESKVAFENRCIESRNKKRRERKLARQQVEAQADVALKHFSDAKDKLDRIGSFRQESDQQQCLLNLYANVDAGIYRARSRQGSFRKVVLASWESGRKQLPTTWEKSCKGGMVPFFPRYLLSVDQDMVQVGGDTTLTEGDTDYETDGESAVPRKNVGAIRCAVRVSLPEDSTAQSELQVAETTRWSEIKALMAPQRVIVRVYVIEGTGLRAMHGNSSSTYLQCSLGKQIFDTKNRCVSKTLNPEWRETFEFDTILPGPAVVKLQVKHRSSFSNDKEMGVTEIDLERRYYCEQWRRRKLCHIETRDLNAKGLKQLAKSFGNTGHGSVKLWVDIHQQHIGVPVPPPVDISRPPTEHFQLRLIIWSAEGIPLQGSNKALKCHNMSFSAHIRTSEGGHVHEEKKETDTHWRAKDGRGNFNYRMVFDFAVDPRLPVRQPCLLTLKCWDKEPLRLTNKLIGYKEINISDILEKALQERLHNIKRRQIIDEHLDIGNVQELQKLLNRLKEQNARADEERADQEKADKIKRFERATVNEEEEEAEEETISAETISARSSNVYTEMCTTCCGAKSQNLASAIGQLDADPTEVDALHATHEYRKNNVRCLHLNMMTDPQPGVDKAKVWASIELMHKSLADDRKAGDGRSEPNEHPILEEPVREKIGIRNVMGSLSVLVGAKNVKLAKLLIGVVLLVMIAMEIVPQVSSAFLMQALRKGLPLPCSAGFQKASNAHDDACGAHQSFLPHLALDCVVLQNILASYVLLAQAGPEVYGTWMSEEKLTWKPPLEANVLECLGPENCPGLNCEKNWTICTPPSVSKCINNSDVVVDRCWSACIDKSQKQHTVDSCWKANRSSTCLQCEKEWTEEKDPACGGETCGCRKWYPDLMRQDPLYFDATIANLCQATREPIGERTGVAASVAPKDKFHLYNVTGTKYRYAVDVQRRRSFYHDDPGTYKSIEDPDLLKRAERLVAEKCRYGGAYYALTHYGISTEDPDETSCEALRDLTVGRNWTTYTRWLRQQGLDGWFWSTLFGQQYGFLRTPLLLPWEIDSCATVPCLGQCIAVEADPSNVECPSTPSLWPVRMIGNIITNVVVPLFALRVILHFSASMVSRLRCCPRECKDAVNRAQRVRRWCWFVFMRGARKFRKLGNCAHCFLVTLVLLSLFFFSQ